ncbi:hypothetical protein KORDIASMS9_03107 [Kordia sp. SMS9]|uniref:hypothetical protein n=1 Tax=Kordia sp. SMS9 TaxID=2282170 RepID=UPI000E0D1D3E|nr:hypothetical protein [Kordia sp. SMS9]AXG70860.1 hypothetical protein KORDIASMS9_03107 [Kordia sp. SMS9]
MSFLKKLASTIGITKTINAIVKKQKNRKKTHELVIQKIKCVQTASEWDAGPTKFLQFVVKPLGLFITKKPEEAGGPWSTTQEEWENQNEAVDSWIDGIKSLGQGGKSRDQLYVEMSSNRIWPENNKHYDINSGEEVTTDIVIPWFDTMSEISFKLKEWDVIKDDDLGGVTLKRADFDESKSHQIVKVVSSETEGSVYILYLKLKKV